MIANSSFAEFYGTGTASEMPAGRSYLEAFIEELDYTDTVPMSKLNTAPAAIRMFKPTCF